MEVRAVPPQACVGCGADGIHPSELPSLPWSVEARSPTGRVLLTLVVRAGSYFSTQWPDGRGETRGAVARVDLSCGRLDIWNGVPLLGPLPGPGSPGDCDP